MSINAYQVYRKTQVSTASQSDLLLMLFDGAVRFTSQALDLLEKQDLPAVNEKVQKSQAIVMELIASLDFDAGDLAQNLYSLYEFIFDQLLQGNTKKEAQHLEIAKDMLIELRQTWREAVGKS